MSKANVEKVIEEILSDEHRLSEFLACEDQDELYRYCLTKGSGYTREEFDEFIEETLSKVNQNSLSDGGAKASFGKKIRQAFTKVLAASLAIFSAAPVVQNFMPQVDATKVNSKIAENSLLEEQTEAENEVLPESQIDSETSDVKKLNIKRVRKTKKSNIATKQGDLLRWIGNNKLVSVSLAGMATKIGYDLFKKNSQNNAKNTSLAMMTDLATMTEELKLGLDNPSMTPEQLRSNLRKLVELLKTYIFDGPENDNFAGLPPKPRFSQSRAAQELISEINNKLEEPEGLDYTAALNFFYKAIEIESKVNEEKQFWAQNRPKDYVPDFTLKNLKIKGASLVKTLAEKGIKSLKPLNKSQFPVYSAKTTEGHVFVKILVDHEMAKNELKGIKNFNGIKSAEKIIRLTVDSFDTTEGRDISNEVYVVVSEFAPGGYIGDLLESETKNLNNDNKEKREILVLKMVKPLVSELKKLHEEHKRIHGDLKEKNFNIYKKNEDFFVQLFDLGSGETTAIDEEKYQMGEYTPLYLSPECLSALKGKRRMKNSPQRDVWALGIIIHNLAKGSFKIPYVKEKKGENMKQTKIRIAQTIIDKNIKDENLNATNAEQPHDLKELWKLLLIKDPDKRATIGQVIEWIDNLIRELGHASNDNTITEEWDETTS